jgi:hypothetical protein
MKVRIICLLLLVLEFSFQARAGCGDLSQKGGLLHAATHDERIKKLPKVEDGSYVKFRFTMDQRGVPTVDHTPQGNEIAGRSNAIQFNRQIMSAMMHEDGIVVDQDFIDVDNGIWIFVGRFSRHGQFDSFSWLANNLLTTKSFVGKTRFEIIEAAMTKVNPIELRFMRFEQGGSLSKDLLQKLFALDAGEISEINLKFTSPPYYDLSLQETIAKFARNIESRGIPYTMDQNSFRLTISKEEEHFDFIFDALGNSWGDFSIIESAKILQFPSRHLKK